MNTEEKLREQIKKAQADGQFNLVKDLMTELIEIQKEVPVPEVSKEFLISRGINMLKVEKEKEMREQIKEAQQDGDFTKVHELTRELIRLQKSQPEYRKVRMYE